MYRLHSASHSRHVPEKGCDFESLPVKDGYQAFVSPEHLNDCLRYRWRTHPGRNTFYIISGENVFLHHLIYQLENKPIPEVGVIDHINGNGFDCTISNLRTATFRENALNTKDASLMWEGIRPKYVGSEKFWEYRITLGQETNEPFYLWIGKCVNPIQAAHRYDRELMRQKKKPVNFPNLVAVRRKTNLE